ADRSGRTDATSRADLLVEELLELRQEGVLAQRHEEDQRTIARPGDAGVAAGDAGTIGPRRLVGEPAYGEIQVTGLETLHETLLRGDGPLDAGVDRCCEALGEVDERSAGAGVVDLHQPGLGGDADVHRRSRDRIQRSVGVGGDGDPASRDGHGQHDEGEQRGNWSQRTSPSDAAPAPEGDHEVSLVPRSRSRQTVDRRGVSRLCACRHACSAILRWWGAAPAKETSRMLSTLRFASKDVSTVEETWKQFVPSAGLQGIDRARFHFDWT